MSLRPMTGPVLVLLLCSCSSSTPVRPPGSGDGGPGPGAADAESLLPACGPGPYVTLHIVVVGASMDPTPPRIEGAVFTSPSCPSMSLISAADGSMSGRVTQGVPFYGRYEAKNWAKTLIPEELFTMDVPDLVVTLPPAILGVLIPNFSPTTTAIFVNLFKDGGRGACAALDGVSFSVVDHPEAKLTYFSADPVPVATGGTATTTGGRAAITGLPEGSPVTVLGQKAGCTVTLKKDAATGRSPLEAGEITIAGAYLRD